MTKAIPFETIGNQSRWFFLHGQLTRLGVEQVHFSNQFRQLAKTNCINGHQSNSNLVKWIWLQMLPPGFFLPFYDMILHGMNYYNLAFLSSITFNRLPADLSSTKDLSIIVRQSNWSFIRLTLFFMHKQYELVKKCSETIILYVSENSKLN